MLEIIDWIITNVSFIDLITAIGSIATAITVVFLWKSFDSQKKQLLVSNYDVLTDYIGSEKTRYARRILTKHYESPISKTFFEKFPLETNQEFDEYNEWGKYIGAIYSRVSFLLSQDKELKAKFIEHHGYTLGIMWIMYKPFMEMWEKHDAIKEYKEFKKMGTFCYEKEEELIKKFLVKKIEQNQKRIQFEWFIEKRKSPLEW